MCAPSRIWWPFNFGQQLACRSDVNKPSGRLPSGIPQIPMKSAGSVLDHFRTTLPVHKAKNGIISTIWNNSVTLISGDTGSGKTTQVLACAQCL